MHVSISTIAVIAGSVLKIADHAREILFLAAADMVLFFRLV
jgi:hypothetical protein